MIQTDDTFHGGSKGKPTLSNQRKPTLSNKHFVTHQRSAAGVAETSTTSEVGYCLHVIDVTHDRRAVGGASSSKTSVVDRRSQVAAVTHRRLSVDDTFTSMHETSVLSLQGTVVTHHRRAPIAAAALVCALNMLAAPSLNNTQK